MCGGDRERGDRERSPLREAKYERTSLGFDKPIVVTSKISLGQELPKVVGWTQFFRGWYPDPPRFQSVDWLDPNSKWTSAEVSYQSMEEAKAPWPPSALNSMD